MTLTIGIHGVQDPTGRQRSHDHGVAIMREGRVLVAQELERVTRMKHDGSMAQHADGLLEPWLMDNDEDVRLVLVNTFMGSSFESRSGRILVDGPTDLPVPAMFSECYGRVLGREPARTRFYCVAHEVAHLGTCLPFFGPFRPNSLLVHIDGGASRSNASAWFYDGKALRCLDHSWHPRLKAAVNNFNASALSRAILGLTDTDHLSMPGKLMGLATRVQPQGDALAWLRSLDWLRSVAPGALVTELKKGPLSGKFGSFSPSDPACQIISACMQRTLEEDILMFVLEHRAATGAEYLYFSGGAAMNVHSNMRLEKEFGVGAVMVPPAPTDAGLALGAAGILEWHLAGAASVHSPFLNRVVTSAPAPPSAFKTTTEVADVIARGGVVGTWFGDGELGPRALGHRSILFRADSVELRQRVSETMKRREWYRPVAPIIARQHAAALLEGDAAGSGLSSFMLGAWRVTTDGARELGGCVHADGSVRAQVVAPEDAALRHLNELLGVLWARHRIRALVNTSFNGPGEPIVHSAEDAVSCSSSLRLSGIWCN